MSAEEMAETTGTLNVLVVDDQKSMRSILKDLLGKVGVSDVAEAESGEEAFEYLKTPAVEYPDVIICDLHMEHMDGLEFCSRVRRSKNLRNNAVPILILTGDKDPMLHDVSKQVGAVTVLTKPISAEKLLQQINKAVGFAFA